jgi:hypothetical protein
MSQVTAAIRTLIALSVLTFASTANVNFNNGTQANAKLSITFNAPANASLPLVPIAHNSTGLLHTKNGMAINFNSLANGAPLWSNPEDHTDHDQEIQLVSNGKGAFYLNKVGTNKVVSAQDNLRPNSTLEVWDMVPGAYTQLWVPLAVGNNGYVWALQRDQSLVINIPFQQAKQKLYLSKRGNNDPDQIYYYTDIASNARINYGIISGPITITPPIETVQPTPPVVVPTTPKVPNCPGRGTTLSSDFKYEAVIAAKNWNTQNLVGHAFFGIVKTSNLVVATGNCASFTVKNYSFKTVSAEGPFKPVPSILFSQTLNGVNQSITSSTNQNYTTDMDLLRSYYNSGAPKYLNGFVYLRSTISSEKYASLFLADSNSLKKLTGCYEYEFLPVVEGSSQGFCHCGDVSARMYGQATGNWSFNRDAKPAALYGLINRY